MENRALPAQAAGQTVAPLLRLLLREFFPPDFRRRKVFLALWIIGLGMLAAVVWNAFESSLGYGYPENTFLFNPNARFGDFTDNAVGASVQSNPYRDPFAVYLPFAWVCLREISAKYYYPNLIACFYLGMAGLFLLCNQALAPVITRPWERTFLSLLFLVLAYPVICCLDRGNVEIVVAMGSAAAVFFFSRNREMIGMLCLLPAVCFKLYPVLLLLLLLRQRKVALATGCLAASLALTLLSVSWLSLTLKTAWNSYYRNMAFFTDIYVYQNFCLEGSASPWNAAKVCLISAIHLGIIPPIDFNVGGEFVTTAYAVYSGAMMMLALVLAIYVCLLEKEFLRCAMVLFLCLAMATPTGADYRLIYAGIALVLLMILRTRRAHDWIILVLLALTMVPKKEILLPYIGRTETYCRDVSIQVLLNPIFVLTALFFLLYDARGYLDFRWSMLRWGRFSRAIVPGLPASPTSKT